MLDTQLDNGLVPVVSPLSADDEGTLLNINADTVAAALAAALGAAKLVLATGAPGILEDRTTRLRWSPTSTSLASRSSRARRARRRHAAQGGAIEAAITGGVPRVHVLIADCPTACCWRSSPTGHGTLVVENETR